MLFYNPGSIAKCNTEENRVSLIIIALLFYTTPAIADESHVIKPNQSFKFVTLLQGNSINITTSQITPFGVHSIFVTSIGNKTLSANMQQITGSASGLWFISLFGTGAQEWADFSLGVIPATSSAALIDIGFEMSFALATVSIFVTSPVDAENPVSYTLKIAQ